jgi:hypothetical protein
VMFQQAWSMHQRSTGHNGRAAWHKVLPGDTTRMQLLSETALCGSYGRCPRVAQRHTRACATTALPLPAWGAGSVLLCRRAPSTACARHPLPQALPAAIDCAHGPTHPRSANSIEHSGHTCACAHAHWCCGWCGCVCAAARSLCATSMRKCTQSLVPAPRAACARGATNTGCANRSLLELGTAACAADKQRKMCECFTSQARGPRCLATHTHARRPAALAHTSLQQAAPTHLAAACRAPHTCTSAHTTASHRRHLWPASAALAACCCRCRHQLAPQQAFVPARTPPHTHTHHFAFPA